MENLVDEKKPSTTKRPFEELDKEELIAKCKALLALAQKAKLAKSELQKDVDKFQNQLKVCDLEKQAKDDKIYTLQELVDSLTEQKLTYITEIDSSQNKIKTLNVLCMTFEEDIAKLKNELSNKESAYVQVAQKLSEFDNEAISLKRQNARLLEENEQLINQMTELESKAEEFNKIGLQQQEQLKILEEKTKTDDIEDLHKKIKKLEEIHSQCTNEDEKLKELTDLYDKERQKNEKAHIKLRVYKDKILKCADCINQLKNSRFILNKIVMEYSENIPRWQTELIRASTLLDEQLSNLTTENSELKARLENIEKNVSESDVNQGAELEKKLSDEVTELQSKNYLLKEQIQQILNENKTLEEQIKDFKEQLCNESVSNKVLRQSIEELNKQIADLHMKKGNEDNEDKLKYQIKSLESEKAILVKEKVVAKENMADLENANKLLNGQVNELQLKTEELKSKVEVILQDNEKLKTIIEKDEASNILKEECNSYKDMFENLKKEYDNLQDLNGLLQEEVQTLKLSLEQPKDEVDDLSDINVSLQADIVKLETKLSAYKQENALLLNEIKDCRAQIIELDKIAVHNEEAKSKLINYKTENAELLNEMKEINQVLKERGETISKLEKAVSEMERLIETLEKDRDSIKGERNELLITVETLRSELDSVKKIKTEGRDTYEKILVEKENAVKIIKENEATIAVLHEEIDKLKQHTTAGTELPNEDMSTSTVSRAEEHARMRDLDETFEDKYSKLRLFALKLKKKLNETSLKLQAVEQENAKLKEQLDSSPDSLKAKSAGHDVTDNFTVTNKQEQDNELISKIISLSKNITTLEQTNKNLEDDVKNINDQLLKEIDSHKVTKEQLEKALRDVKKKNVLSLEMEDYERSMKELTTKMEDNKKKIVQMESTIDTQEGTITAMKTQIKLLEEQIKTEEAQNRRTKEDLHNAIEESKEKDNIINLKNDIITNLTHELEDEKRKKQETDLHMTEQLADKEKIIMHHAEEKIELNNKIKRLEFRCAELNDKLQVSNIELADLKTDYASYKVRAQAVLRQNQTVDHSHEEQLKEEAAALKTQVEALTQKLAAVQEQFIAASIEAEAQRKRAAEAAAEAARAQARTARLHADLARLSQQIDADRAHHKLQVSTLTQCYKSQINELEVKLQKETESLKKQLALQESVKTSKPEESTSEKYLLPVIPKDEGSDSELDINVSLIPREEGEGSESAPSPPLLKSFLAAGSRRSPIPLERLLEEGVSEDDGLDRSSLALTSEQEIAELKRKVQGQQQKVKHVTVLLAESERECARMAQLAELLKAELRRVRGADLAPHNTEYMKNVTLKFLTLPPGDERSRLIPVLQKILTLSNEETQKIQAIAKGQDPNSNKGWGSYLPWPGGK